MTAEQEGPEVEEKDFFLRCSTLQKNPLDAFHGGFLRQFFVYEPVDEVFHVIQVVIECY